jgi:hypothetical protein
MSSGNKRLLGVCALVLLALAAPSLAAAGKCPKGQAGLPPYCAKVKFWLQTVKHEGTSAKIRIKVSAPGVVTAKAKYLVTVKATAKKAGRFWLPLKLDKAGVAALEKKKVLHVRITFTYTPVEGLPLVKHKQIRFKLKGAKSPSK